jgi:SAM-dependent methyltransferase
MSSRRVRLVQAVHDLARKPFSELSILDLASLEGQFTFEFASRGAQVTGIEGRQSNIEKALAFGEKLGLPVTFIKDDVRNLSVQKYGSFDIVLSLGILYHLDGPDIPPFLKAIHEMCRDFVIVDTHVALRPEERFGEYSGWYFSEPPADEENPWASLGNRRSFWLTKPSLVNALADAGFTSVMEIHFPAMNDMAADRVTVAAFKSRVTQPSVIFTDPKTLGERVPEAPAVISLQQPVDLDRGACAHEEKP